MTTIDETHDPARNSWLSSANGHADFPIQNLPFGVFSSNGDTPRGGVAIGDHILDMAAAVSAGLFSGEARLAAEAAAGAALNSFLALRSSPRQALRVRLGELLDADKAHRTAVEPLLVPASEAKLHLPANIGDYTDFYVGIHHATNVGKLFRPDNPLLPNYKYVPIGYHGRASSISLSGERIRRPLGQAKLPEFETPIFGPSNRLDYELELGVWVGPGSSSGEPIPIGAAADHISGFCLLNDWSARDLQAWEYQPLGPFLSKNFATTISAWIVTPEALAPFRVPQPPRPAGEPEPLPYLLDAQDQSEGALELELEVLLTTAASRSSRLPPQRIALSNTRHMYWTVAQMLTHHASNGCNLRSGDLLGTGTLSGPGRGECGSLLEATDGGRTVIRLETGEERRFLEDGDEVILRARGKKPGFASIGFGECRAQVGPA